MTAKQVQFRGGSTADHTAFTGAAREITVDTTLWTVRVHDGSTAGGHQLAKAGSNTDITSLRLNQTGLTVKDGTGNYELTFKPNESLTGDRTLNVKVNDADRTIDLSGNLTVTAAASVEGTNTGDQTIELTGDVTGTGTGSFAATIAANAVTLAKMATMATASFLGRITAGAGDPEVLSAADATSILEELVGDAGAGGTKGLAPAPAAGDAAAGKFLKADGTWAAPGASSAPPMSAGGRLSFATATAIMAATITGATSHYFIPYNGGYMPLYDGSSWTMTAMAGELSQAASDATKSPAAAAACCLYNVYGWNDGGTIRATRGPALTRTNSTVTMTIASPCVVTWNSHGLKPGDPVIFTTTGALPTGITAGNVYWVISSGLATNSFRFSASRPGTSGEGSAVNTSGSQSGTHTCTAGWTGTPTAELTLNTATGLYLNTSAITNGPAASRGTYLGTIATDESGTYTFKFGSSALRGGYAFLSLWNFFNRVPIGTFVNDNTDSWNGSNGTRVLDQSYNNHIRALVGIAGDMSSIRHTGCFRNNTTAAYNTKTVIMGIGINSYNTITTDGGVVSQGVSRNQYDGASLQNGPDVLCFSELYRSLASGFTTMFALESVQTDTTMYGDDGNYRYGLQYFGTF